MKTQEKPAPLDVTVKKGAPLFPRIDVNKEIDELNALIEKQMKAAEKEAQNSAENAKQKEDKAPQITFDDFSKVELRAAKVLACEPIKRAKKLLKLIVDDGSAENRQIVSGISQWYKPEDLIGKTVVIVANLKPAKLCGEMSNGMLLAADTADGGVQVLFADDLEPGMRLR